MSFLYEWWVGSPKDSTDDQDEQTVPISEKEKNDRDINKTNMQQFADHTEWVNVYGHRFECVPKCV
jgi:hypothetical protein